MGRTLKNIIICVETLTIVIMAAFLFQSEQATKEVEKEVTEELTVAKLTTQFDKQLEEALEKVNQIESSFNSLLKKAEIYDDWNIVQWNYRVFGYKETSAGLQIIVGNEAGNQYVTATLHDTNNPEPVEMHVTGNGWELNQTGLQSMRYLRFQWYGKDFVMDHNLNVWTVAG